MAAKGIVHVVDDDAAFRNAIERLLRQAGFEPRLHASAGDYLECPEAESPACLLLDVAMPGMSGLELQAALALDARRHGEQRHVEDIRRRYEALTARERQVMAGVVAGLRNKQISCALGTAERTVKTHRARVMGKMGVKTFADLVRISQQLAASGVAQEPAPDSGVRAR